MPTTPDCLIRLTDNDLVVANRGRPFSRAGVISICASHLSNKQAIGPIDEWQSVPDSALIVAIKSHELAAYRRSKNRIIEDANLEQEVVKDYGGRVLWELLQNADDALAPLGATSDDLIGSKGLGFKSVLQITSTPEIHSGDFSFLFSSDLTRQELSSILEDPPAITFRVPHPALRTDQITQLLSPDDYATVIRLPLRIGVFKSVQDWMLGLDSRLLLFMQNVRSIRLEFPNRSGRQFCVSGTLPTGVANADVKIEITHFDSAGKSAAKQLGYRRWARTASGEQGKRHSAALCLRLNGEEAEALEDKPRLSVFFPTEEQLPFRALLHLSLDLEQNRKHVRGDVRMAGCLDLLEQIVSDVTEQVSALEILRSLVPDGKTPASTSDLAGVLWGRVRSVLMRKEFIPTVGDHRVLPENVWLWRDGIGAVVDPRHESLRKHALVAPALMQGVADALEALCGPRFLSRDQEIDLLQLCRNASFKECADALRVMHQIARSDERLRNSATSGGPLRRYRAVPCWWTTKGRGRGLIGDELPALFIDVRQELPAWCTVDCLDPQFRALVERELPFRPTERRPAAQEWVEVCKTGLSEWNKTSVLHSIIVPSLKGKAAEWWNSHGIEALHAFDAWCPDSTQDASILVAADPQRHRLAAALRVPTDKGWLPASQVYAGSAWGGPRSFDNFFAEIDERGVLRAAEDWGFKIDPGHWKERLRYAGVSWEPKLRKETTLALYSDGTPEATASSNLVGWKNYRKMVLDDLPAVWQRRRKVLREHWWLEYWPDSLATEGATILHVAGVVKAVLGSSHASFVTLGCEGQSRHKPSFAAYQLRDLPWLSVGPSLVSPGRVAAPRGAWMPGRGLSGLLPEVEVPSLDGQEKRDLESLLTQLLKVNEELPEPTSPNWTKWLNDLSLVTEAPPEFLERATVRLYRKVFSFSQIPQGLSSLRHVACWKQGGRQDTLREDERSERMLDFSDPRDVRWVDQHFLDLPEVRRALLREGTKLFVLALNEGRQAPIWLGITPLSSSVSIEARNKGCDAQATAELLRRYRVRRPAIAALRQGAGSKLPQPDHVKWTLVRELAITVNPGATYIRVPWWNEKEESDEAMIDAASPWRGAGALIAEILGHEESADAIENLLAARDEEEVLSRLRTRGISEAALEHAKTEMAELAREAAGLRRSPEEVGLRDSGRPIGGGGPVIEPTDQPRAVGKEALARTEEIAEQRVEKPGRMTSAYGPEGDGGAPRTRDQHRDAAAEVGDAGNGHDERPHRATGRAVTRERIVVRDGVWRDAQEWLRQKLLELSTAQGWRVSASETRDDENRETDILVSLQEGREIHIEVKHVAGGTMYWTRNEVDKAIALKGNPRRRYLIAVISGESPESFSVRWLLEPLAELASAWRSGLVRRVWVWSKEQFDVVDGASEPWSNPEQYPVGEIRANSFKFEIPIAANLGVPRLEHILEEFRRVETA